MPALHTRKKAHSFFRDKIYYLHGINLALQAIYSNFQFITDINLHSILQMHAILLFMDSHTAKAPSLQRPSHYLVKPSLRHRSTCNTASKSRKGKTFIPQRSVTSVENILSKPFTTFRL